MCTLEVFTFLYKGKGFNKLKIIKIKKSLVMLQKTNPCPHSETKPKPVTHGFNYKEKKNKTATKTLKIIIVEKYF